MNITAEIEQLMEVHLTFNMNCLSGQRLAAVMSQRSRNTLGIQHDRTMVIQDTGTYMHAKIKLG